jgi:hypothetical protein
MVFEPERNRPRCLLRFTVIADCGHAAPVGRVPLRGAPPVSRVPQAGVCAVGRDPLTRRVVTETATAPDPGQTDRDTAPRPVRNPDRGHR